MVKKAAAAITVVMGADDSYSKAVAKASDPKMTTKDNPLASKCESCNPAILDRNMERLHEDAHMRRDPTHGSVYSAIMDNRYGG